MVIQFINSILRIFNWKLIKTSESFNWRGNEYHLPMKCGYNSINGKSIIVDYLNNKFPIEFNNEEDARFLINVLDVAINPYYDERKQN